MPPVTPFKASPPCLVPVVLLMVSPRPVRRGVRSRLFALQRSTDLAQQSQQLHLRSLRRHRPGCRSRGSNQSTNRGCPFAGRYAYGRGNALRGALGTLILFSDRHDWYGSTVQDWQIALYSVCLVRKLCHNRTSLYLHHTLYGPRSCGVTSQTSNYLDDVAILLELRMGVSLRGVMGAARC